MINPKHAIDNEEVSFADGYPLLVISKASLEDLNSKLDTSIRMERFRPNIVVEGEVPYGEDYWNWFKIRDLNFRGIKPCARCIMTTINPQTGMREGVEPVKTLASFRKRNNKIFFGMNVVWSHVKDAKVALPTIHVGDVVEVLSRQDFVE